MENPVYELKLLATTDGAYSDESKDTVHLYLASPDMQSLLSDVYYHTNGMWENVYGKGCPVPEEVAEEMSVETCVMDFLHLHEETNVAPGATFHRYSVSYNPCGYVTVVDTLSINI